MAQVCLSMCNFPEASSHATTDTMQRWGCAGTSEAKGARRAAAETSVFRPKAGLLLATAAHFSGQNFRLCDEPSPGHPLPTFKHVCRCAALPPLFISL